MQAAPGGTETLVLPTVEAMLARLLDGSTTLVAVFDEHDILRRSNRAYREAYHVDDGEEILWADIMRRNHAHGRGAIIDANDIEAWLVTALSRRGKLASRAFEVDLVDGRWLWMCETVLENGWSLAIASDVTNLKAGERELRQLTDKAIREAQTDSLTGISNRRYMMLVLDRLLASPAGNPPDSICLIDIDHFKSINDRHGHEVGDEVLVDFSRRMRNAVRPSDTFGRIGGEEFMLVFPGLGHAEAERVLARILGEIRSRAYVGRGVEVFYTVSAGLVERRRSDDARSIYGRADQALYDAKQGGRDRIQVAA